MNYIHMSSHYSTSQIYLGVELMYFSSVQQYQYFHSNQLCLVFEGLHSEGSTFLGLQTLEDILSSTYFLHQHHHKNHLHQNLDNQICLDLNFQNIEGNDLAYLQGRHYPHNRHHHCLPIEFHL